MCAANTLCVAEWRGWSGSRKVSLEYR